MVSFVILRQPVTTLVTTFNNPNKLTKDILILKLFDNKQTSCLITSFVNKDLFIISQLDTL